MTLAEEVAALPVCEHCDGKGWHITRPAGWPELVKAVCFVCHGAGRISEPPRWCRKHERWAYFEVCSAMYVCKDPEKPWRDDGYSCSSHHEERPSE